MELQLAPAHRNTGLGALLMRFLEHAGAVHGLRKAMLTVFKANTGALRFYARLGYTPDRISPSMCMSERRAARYSYEILGKKLDSVV
ncbi:hypothetical protein BC830DRAFT_1062388 [Chytriomyces sp. MP71]|nr:hypothetical protein BC830DRAFT_1062388 [Chytriomyces sp. MP71]